MSAPFQPGDVVVCVDAQTPNQLGVVPKMLKQGGYYRVVKVLRSAAYGWAVVLDGVQHGPGGAAKAKRFRKIDADVTEDFRQQLRSLKSPKPTLNPARHSRERVA